jgi:DNA polymerase-3 subunit epsilon
VERLSDGGGGGKAPGRPAVDAYLRTPMPDPATPWRQAGLCVLDLETTGLDSPADEIIAFATMPIDGGRARVRGAHSRLVRPRRMPGADSILIHGLRSEDLVGAPALSQVLGELLDALAGRVLVAHVATLEERFLRGAMLPEGIPFRNPVIDTHALAVELYSRRRVPGPESIRLAGLARELGLPVHRPHDAAGDVLTTTQVFLALATQLDAIEPQTIGSLRALRHRSDPWPTLRRVLRRLRGA